MSRIRARGGQADPAWLLGGPLGWIMAVTGDRLVAHGRDGHGRDGLGASGAVCPSGVERPRWLVRFTRLIRRRVRAFSRIEGPRRFGGNSLI